MEAIKLCRLDTPIIFIEARINLSRFVVTGCAAKTSATVTRSEERFSRNAETDLVCRLLLVKKNFDTYVIVKYGPIVHITSDKMERVNDWFECRGRWSLLN